MRAAAPGPAAARPRGTTSRNMGRAVSNSSVHPLPEDQSSRGSAGRPNPGRFRRRLTGAFVLTAGITGALLAVTAFFMIRQYRERAFLRSAEEQARLSFLSAPPDLSLADFEGLLDEYQARAGIETVAVAGDTVFASSPGLGPEDVPFDEQPRPGELLTAVTEVDGVPYLVVAGAPRRSPVTLYFFFPRAAHLSALTQHGAVLAAAWLIAVTAAALFGDHIARRTLRPVRAAAEASHALAEGLLETRLARESDDEFGVWSQSFNHMADALAAKIDALSRARERERQFTADVAHELRTPLAGMFTAASLVEDEIDAFPESARRPAMLLIEDVRRLHGLVLDLLELARLDSGEDGVHLERLDVASAVAAVVRPWANELPGITIRVPRDLRVMADRRRFQRVLGNLVANGVRHGGGGIEIDARHDDGFVAIDVRDHGPGIGDGEVDRIFDRFYKADTSRSRGGSGLGLAIAREQARAQGGTVSVSNAPGGGARFSLRLPAAAGDASGVDDGEADQPRSKR